MCMDMDNREFEAITLHGSWARERHIQRQKIGIGDAGCHIRTGNLDTRIIHLLHWSPLLPHRIPGEVYGVQLVYSGNYEFRADVNQYDSVRLQAGINPVDFAGSWKQARTLMLRALLTYSALRGLSGMTAHYHDFIRQHIIRSPYKIKTPHL